jgi:hypothetical protein
MAPIVAEIYGPDYAGVRRMARELETRFKADTDIVDVDTRYGRDSGNFRRNTAK